MERLRNRQEWHLARALHRAAPGLAWCWWLLLVVRGALPALLAVATGSVVGAANDGRSLTTPLTLAAVALALMQVTPPLHQAVGANLGSRTANWFERPARRSLRLPLRASATSRIRHSSTTS